MTNSILCTVVSGINKDGMIEFVIRLQIYNGIQTRWAAKRLGV